MSFNLNFKDKNSDYYSNEGTLSMSELSTIVNSVSKYSYRNFSIKQFSEIQANRRSKRKQYNKVIDTSDMFFSIDKDNIREYLRNLPSGLFISGVAKSLGISRKTIYRLSKNL
jgi:DNA invertase Pin-like site-specific DNA recombinase